MHDIICPHCSKAFKIDESGYADILRQVRDREFDILQFWLRTEPLFRLMLEKWPICQGKSGASISLVNLTWQNHLPVERARLYLFSFKKKFLAFT